MASRFDEWRHGELMDYGFCNVESFWVPLYEELFPP